jgi:hypothetical protein
MDARQKALAVFVLWAQVHKMLEFLALAHRNRLAAASLAPLRSAAPQVAGLHRIRPGAAGTAHVAACPRMLVISEAA